MSFGYQEFIAVCLEGLGTILVKQGAREKAIQLWRQAEELRQKIGVILPSVYRTAYEREVAAVKTQLGELSFEVAWTS